MTSIGVSGIEGSKPGASVMSTWFSNACIGLGPDDYGKLLGEVTFTCSRLSAEWAAMSTKDDGHAAQRTAIGGQAWVYTKSQPIMSISRSTKHLPQPP